MKRPAVSLPPEVARDLRRLLPIIVILIVAIVVVPMQIKGDGRDPVRGPDLAVSSKQAKQDVENQPVVLAEAPTLRDSHRLDEIDSKNPFHQPSVPEAAPDPAADPSSTGASPADPASALPGVSTPAASTGGEPVAPSTPDPSTPSPAPSAPPPESGGGTTLVSVWIDVRVGAVGNTRILKDVKSLALLPDSQHPVVEYVRGDYDLTNAVFIVSPGVVSTEGDGNCAPNPQSCQFLKLGVGEEQSFEYEDGKRYRLALLEMRIHEQPLSEDGAPAATDAADFSASQLAEILGA